MGLRQNFIGLPDSDLLAGRGCELAKLFLVPDKQLGAIAVDHLAFDLTLKLEKINKSFVLVIFREGTLQNA